MAQEVGGLVLQDVSPVAQQIASIPALYQKAQENQNAIQQGQIQNQQGQLTLDESKMTQPERLYNSYTGAVRNSNTAGPGAPASGAPVDINAINKIMARDYPDEKSRAAFAKKTPAEQDEILKAAADEAAGGIKMEDMTPVGKSTGIIMMDKDGNLVHHQTSMSPIQQQQAAPAQQNQAPQDEGPAFDPSASAQAATSGIAPVGAPQQQAQQPLQMAMAQPAAAGGIPDLTDPNAVTQSLAARGPVMSDMQKQQDLAKIKGLYANQRTETAAKGKTDVAEINADSRETVQETKNKGAAGRGGQKDDEKIDRENLMIMKTLSKPDPYGRVPAENLRRIQAMIPEMKTQQYKAIAQQAFAPMTLNGPRNITPAAGNAGSGRPPLPPPKTGMTRMITPGKALRDVSAKDLQDAIAAGYRVIK